MRAEVCLSNLTIKCPSPKTNMSISGIHYMETDSFTFNQIFHTYFRLQGLLSPFLESQSLTKRNSPRPSPRTRPCVRNLAYLTLQIQICHHTRVKFKSPILWKAFPVKCPTPRSLKMVKCTGYARGNFEGSN